MDAVLADRDVRHDEHTIHLQQRDELVVDVAIANQVREGVDAGAGQILGIVEIEDVRDDAGAVRVGFFDDRAVQRRR